VSVGKREPLLQKLQTDSGAHPASYLTGTIISSRASGAFSQPPTSISSRG